MKIAYIFHGHSRTWDQCYESFFDNIFSSAPGDIFIHTWDRRNTRLGAPWNGWNPLEGENLRISQEYTDISKIFQIYKPKVMIVEEDFGVDDSFLPEHLRNLNTTKPHLGTKNMLYQSRKIFEEANKFENYDRFFSTRMDILYPSKFDIEEIKDDKLRIPKDNNLDLWMFGTKEQIDIKTNYYYNIDDYWINTGLTSFYEVHLERYLNDNNIFRGKNMVPSNLDCKIIRLF